MAKLKQNKEPVVQSIRALETAKKALDLLNRSDQKPDTSATVSDFVSVENGEIVDVESSEDGDGECPPSHIQFSREELLALQSAPLSRKRPDNLPKLPKSFLRKSAKKEYVMRSAKGYVRQIDVKTAEGRIVKYLGGDEGVGRAWSREMRDGVGVILGYDRGFLLLKWSGEEFVRRVLFIVAEGDIGIYQFEFVHVDVDQLPLVEVIKDDNKSIPVAEDADVWTPSQCESCQDENCPAGQFLTHYEDSYQGMRVRFIGNVITDQEMKKRVGVVFGFEDKLQVKWQGTQEVKKYSFFSYHRGDFTEIQFKFCCSSEPVVFPELLFSSTTGLI